MGGPYPKSWCASLLVAMTELKTRKRRGGKKNSTNRIRDVQLLKVRKEDSISGSKDFRTQLPGDGMRRILGIQMGYGKFPTVGRGYGLGYMVFVLKVRR